MGIKVRSARERSTVKRGGRKVLNYSVQDVADIMAVWKAEPSETSGPAVPVDLETGPDGEPFKSDEDALTVRNATRAFMVEKYGLRYKNDRGKMSGGVTTELRHDDGGIQIRFQLHPMVLKVLGIEAPESQREEPEQVTANLTELFSTPTEVEETPEDEDESAA